MREKESDFYVIQSRKCIAAWEAKWSQAGQQGQHQYWQTAKETERKKRRTGEDELVNVHHMMLSDGKAECCKERL